MSFIMYQDGVLVADRTGVIRNPLSGKDSFYEAKKLFNYAKVFTLASVGDEIDEEDEACKDFMERLCDALEKYDKHPNLDVNIDNVPRIVNENSLIVMTKRKVYYHAVNEESEEKDKGAPFLRVYHQTRALYYGSENGRVDILLEEGFTAEQILGWLFRVPGAVVDYGGSKSTREKMITFETYRRNLRKQAQRKPSKKPAAS